MTGQPEAKVRDSTNAQFESPLPSSTGFAAKTIPLVALGAPGIAAWGGLQVLSYYYRKNLYSLERAYVRALELCPAAIRKETGFDDVDKLLSTILKGLLIGVLALAASVALGAAIGGVVGFFFGGVGAAPGAVAGAGVGLDLGVAVLTWMGLGFLVASIASGLGELVSVLTSGVTRAWNAADASSHQQASDIATAAEELARAIGILVRLVLQGVVAYFTKNAAVASTKNLKANPVIAAALEELKVSKLGPAFAQWVETNWARLVENPRYNPRLREQRGQTGQTLQERTPETQTPSQQRSAATKDDAASAKAAGKNKVDVDPNVKWDPKTAGPLQQNGLPAYDGKTTYGKFEVDGSTYYLKSGSGQPGMAAKLDPNIKAGAVTPTHVEGHAASIMRQTGASEGTLTINHPNGTCGFCDKVISNILPEGAKMNVQSPAGLGTYVGNAK